MKKVVLSIIILLAAYSFSGCIEFHKISYDIKLDSPLSGKVTIVAYDLRSDAVGNKDLEEDKNNLFNVMLKSDEFVEMMKKQGKDIVSRKLFLNDGKLNGEGTYKFDNINKVEGIQFDDGFYYLTLGLKDSVISTNGQVITSKDHKRILWDSSMKELKFTMFSNSFEQGTYHSMAEYYQKSNNK